MQITSLTLASLLFFVTLSAAGQSYSFEGSVGKAKAHFAITIVQRRLDTSWGPRTVTGSYYLVNQPNRIYQLSGVLKKDRLKLDEMTCEKIARAMADCSTVTAKMDLIGNWLAGFTGKMQNTVDNRSFVVTMRSATPIAE